MSGPPPKAKPTLFGLPPVSFSALYRFATPLDLALSVLGALAGLASGTVLPLFTIVRVSQGGRRPPTRASSSNPLTLWHLVRPQVRQRARLVQLALREDG
jgi:hypothetical protein